MNARHLVRTGALIVVGQVAVASLGITALRLYTNLAPPDVFGESNLILSALALGLQVFVAGFTAAQLRYYSEAEARRAGDEFTREAMIWALRATAVLAGLIVFSWAVARMMGKVVYTPSLVASGIAWLFAMVLRNVFLCRIQAERRQAAYARIQVIEALLLLVVTLIALRLAPRVESFLLGQTLAIVLLLVVILMGEKSARTVFGAHSAANTGFLSKAWSYGMPFAPMSALSWLANLGDRYTLAFFLGADATGRYVAPFSIASRGLNLVSSALCDLFRPILFDAENRQDNRQARRIFASWILCSVSLSTAGVAVIYVAGTLVARLLLAPGYRAGAVDIMLWVSFGYAVFGVTQVLENRLLSVGYSARLLLPIVLGAVANIAFSIVLIRRNGIVGAAQATCASFVFQSMATTGVLLHALRRRGVSGPPEAQI
jgi:O-antigen/teichoic acid export membrane protein